MLQNHAAPPDSFSHELSLHFVRPDVITSVGQAALAAGVMIGDEHVYRSGALVPLLEQLIRAGGSWQPLAGPIEWVAEQMVLSAANDAAMRAVHSDVDLGIADLPCRAYHAYGAFLLSHGDVRIVALGGQTKDSRLRAWPGVALFADSRQTIGTFLRTIGHARAEPRLRIWGGMLKESEPAAVTEDEVILPGSLKQDLFGWLDRFWRLRERALEHRLPLRRGLLLAGPPGTGKTHLIRHLLTRYPDAKAHLFIAARRGTQEDPFGALLEVVRHEERGAIVILEDIDRLADSGAVTKEYLLNALDGFVEIPAPLLWIATSNDPGLLEKNLLQRPGRFDRIIVFPMPEPAERCALFEKLSGQPIDGATMERLVGDSAELSGAHIREACAAATLAWLDGSSAYGCALEAEVATLRAQHGAADRLERGLAVDRGVGFK